MNRSSGLRQQLVLWSLCFGVWCLLVLAFAGQLIVAHPVSQPPMPLGQALSLSVIEWSAWALLAPLVAVLALRFPLERQTLALNLPVHVVACGVAVVLCALVPRPTG